MPRRMTTSTKVGISLATFAFITLVLFIVLSSPVETIFGLIEDQASDMNITKDVNPLIANFRTVFGLTFVFSLVGLIAWALFASHAEEYEETVDEYGRRFYR